jgi:serine/threonine-protein kinase
LTSATLIPDSRFPIPKITDFGIARLKTDNGRAGQLTQVGHLLGTVDYLSPEQAENPQGVDIRSDLFSLGCTFFYLLTGRAPYAGANAVERVSARLLGAAPRVRSLRPEVPMAVERIVAKMLARDRARRYQTPAEVAAALQSWVETGWLRALPRHVAAAWSRLFDRKA